MKSHASYTGLYTIAVAALFLAGFLMLVILGARSYQAAAAGESANMQQRALLSYLTTTLKGYDTAGAVQISEDASLGTVISIADGTSGYALRLYVSDGNLVEDYAAKDAALDPAMASVIAPTNTFSAEISEDGLLSVTTDAGTALFTARSEGGGR